MISWLKNLFHREDPKWESLSPRQKSVVQTWRNVCLSEGWTSPDYQFSEAKFFCTAVNAKGIRLASWVFVNASDLHGSLLDHVNVAD